MQYEIINSAEKQNQKGKKRKNKTLVWQIYSCKITKQYGEEIM